MELDAVRTAERNIMTIEINRETRTFDVDRLTLTDVVKACALPERGIAVAVNNKVVARGDWGATELADGDCLTVIQAVCGG